jgi:hypothetical protein
MEIKVYGMYALGGIPGQGESDFRYVSYDNITNANRRIQEYLLKQGFSSCGGGFQTIPSKGLLQQSYEAFAILNLLIETGTKIERNEKNQSLNSLLQIGIATTPKLFESIHPKIESIVNMESVRIKTCSDSRELPRRDLNLFRKMYEYLINSDVNRPIDTVNQDSNQMCLGRMKPTVS